MLSEKLIWDNSLMGKKNKEKIPSEGKKVDSAGKSRRITN